MILESYCGYLNSVLQATVSKMIHASHIVFLVKTLSMPVSKCFKQISKLVNNPKLLLHSGNYSSYTKNMLCFVFKNLTPGCEGEVTGSSTSEVEGENPNKRCQGTSVENNASCTCKPS